MDDEHATSPATPRRDFLRVMALAPALAAGCAGARAAGPSAGAPPVAEAPPASAATSPDPLGPLRDFPLDLEDEPAFVFRAHPARPGV